jgi:hypothetical protein
MEELVITELRLTRQSRRLLLCGLLCAVTLLAPSISAGADTRARLAASFTPNKLGARTTLDFGFSFSAPPGQVPPPLTQVQLRYPSNLGIDLSGLGQATCTVQILAASGPRACPPNAVMGHGVVLTGIVLGTTIISEEAPITILRAPYDRRSNLALLFYAEGTVPVSSDIVFSGLLVPAPMPFGGQVNIGVPLVATLPGAPDISVVNMKAALGPKGVIYYEKVGGATLAFHPDGILLPARCPRGGLRFAARFTFADGSHASAHTSVRCRPAARRRRRSNG